MNLFTPTQYVENYINAGKSKAEMPLLKMFCWRCWQVS